MCLSRPWPCRASGILALLGGLSILLGYRARFGAFLIVLFLVPVTLFMHKFWGLSDPQMAMMQRVNFLKNVALLGGALHDDVLRLGSVLARRLITPLR